ncbi:MAG: lipopolysaccharide biosynthesis protein [Cyclobacteriaceae bacterium]|nr:lipopolysaccharide biosynthesis protein [Cyclobacteriaceae bacterium]
MEGLKQKALNGAKWSLLEKVVNIGFEFAVGIVLARILMPSDFGIVAIITVFISFSDTFINSGFSQSLIRNPDVDNRDFSTIFIFNLVVGSLFYFFIFISSSSIAGFYQNNDLILFIKVLTLSILISSFSLVQRVNLIKDMNFKLLSKINIGSSLLSGILALIFAINGFGIWSLILKTLSREILHSYLLWLNSKWRPSVCFDTSKLKNHFKYSSSLLLSGIIGQLYNNVLAITIGKVYSIQILGYYNRAQLFSRTITDNIGGVMTSVSFPALAKVQEDKEKFLDGVRLLLRQIFYVIGILMVLLFFSSKTLIPFLLGDKWTVTGMYIQYLSMVYFIAALNSIIINSISVIGMSKIYLLFQISSFILNVIAIYLGTLNGINTMLMMLIIFNSGLYLAISYVFNGIFNYSIIDQFNDYKKILLVLFSIILIGVLYSFFDNTIIIISSMIITQIFLAIALSVYFRVEEYFLLIKLFSRKDKSI